MKVALEFRRKNSESWHEWGPAQAVWLLQQLNIPMDNGGLGPDPEEPDAFSLTSDAPGSVMTPWKMSTIEQWCGAAIQHVESGLDTGMYEVGGVLLERNPSEGDFNNYITAVIDPVRNPFAVSRKESPRGNLIVFDEEVDRSDRMIYEIKCDRLKSEGRDQEIAALARRVMKGANRVPNDLIELPNTLGAMFISEAARLPLMLPLGIMLLDFMEASLVYGREGTKQYTWKKMMAYTKDDEDRLTKAKLHGGKHPMMHENTIKQAKTFAESFNVVTLRSISILVQWLHTYLQRNPSGWETRMVRADRAEFTQSNSKPIRNRFLEQFGVNVNRKESQNTHGEFYTAAIRPALRARSTGLDLLF